MHLDTVENSLCPAFTHSERKSVKLFPDPATPKVKNAAALLKKRKSSWAFPTFKSPL